MAKFFERFGLFRGKETAERTEEPVNARAEMADAANEQSEVADGWAQVEAMATTNGEQASWDDLKDEKFAGDEPVASESPEIVMGGGIDEEQDETGEANEQEPNETLRALKDFFRMDMAVKNEMLRLAPEATDMYDAVAQMDYADKAYKGFMGMEWRFEKINEEFHLADPEVIEKFFGERAENFQTGRYDARGIYQENISKLRPEFVEEVKKECFGYGLFGNAAKVISEAQSVNELLHACHSAIMNDEKVLQRVPALATKREGGDEVVLRGDEGEIGRRIFEAIPEEIDAGPIDIVSVDERAIMMVRDRGHALVVQAEPFEKGSEQVLVNYNIPKIINRGMIEALPGIGKITSEGANGQFVCAANEVGEKVKDFIEMVPTDADFE